MHATRIGGRAWRRHAGFTLIEMVVVTAILAMMAALIVPNLVAIHRSQAIRAAQADILRLPTDARNEAMKSGMPVILRVNGNNLELDRWAESDTDYDPQNPQQTQPYRSVSLGGDIQVDTAQQNGNSADTASWRWIAYPDGSAFSAGLTFRVGGSGRGSLWIPANGGQPEWRGGDLPDTTNDKWTAGELQSSTTTTTGTTGTAR